MRNIYLAQVNYQFGANTFLPYSVARLWAYASARPRVAACYRLAGFVYLREDVEACAARLDDPAVVGVSMYIWNRNWSLGFARAVRRRWPDCCVVIGGPEVPDDVPDDWFATHPFVDGLVHGEGEIAFGALLEWLAEPGGLGLPAGVDWNDGNGVSRGLPAQRVADVGTLPSPYLAGLFDDLMREPHDWHASQETNRGCPWACRFCQWGSAVMTKVRAFPEEMLDAELEWFADRRIELLYNCDANFGLLKRDLALARRMAALKAERGFPQKFRAAWTKRVHEHVFEAAKVLADSGLSKGATVSLQSMNQPTLDAVRRINVAPDGLPATLRRYADAGIATYSELILGQPLETYDTFADGLDELMDAGQHSGINVYMLMQLANAELNTTELKELYGLSDVEIPMLLLHGSPALDRHAETYRVVVETNTMPHADWRRAYRFAWAVQALHCLGPTQVLARWCRRALNVPYRRFYEVLLCDMGGGQVGLTSVIHRETAAFDRVLSRALRGEAWDLVLRDFGNVVWPPEEWTLLRLCRRWDAFYEELRSALPWQIPLDVWRRQRAAVPEPVGDAATWARDVIWYGRKGTAAMEDAA